MLTDPDEQVHSLLAQKVSRKGVSETKNYLDLFCEYWHLSLSQRLSEEQADRLEQLLHLAESDTLLSTLFSEANYFVTKEVDTLNQKEDIVRYREFQDKLQKGINSNAELVNWDQNLKIKYSIEKSTNKNYFDSFTSFLQQRLKCKGYYGGPIDGYFGPISKDALETFQRKEEICQSNPPSDENPDKGVLIGANTLIALLQ